MTLRDFFFLTLACLCFGANFVISAWAVSGHGVPPFMLGAARALIVIIFMGYFLFKPLPKEFLRLLVVCVCVGPIHLGFLYTGLMSAPASGSAIVSQMLIPFATILSVIFLKERIGWVRGLGIVGAFAGTIIMIYEPGAMSFDVGLIYIVMAYLSLGVGSIIMKTVGDIDWRVYVVWMAVCVFVVMVLASFFFEPSFASVWETSKIPFMVTALYAAVGVTIIAHGQYFRLMKLYDVSVVVPLTLMVPLFATILGVWLLDERLTRQVVVGAGLILPCVYILAKRQAVRTVQED